MSKIDNTDFVLISGFGNVLPLRLDGLYKRTQTLNDGKPSFKSEHGLFLYFCGGKWQDWNIGRNCGETRAVKAWAKVSTELPPIWTTWKHHWGRSRKKKTWKLQAGRSGKIRIVSSEDIEPFLSNLIVSTLHETLCSATYCIVLHR